MMSVREDVLKQINQLRSVVTKYGKHISKDDQVSCELSLQAIQKSFEQMVEKNAVTLGSRPVGSSTTRIVRPNKEEGPLPISKAQQFSEKISPLINKFFDQKIYIGYRLASFFQKAEDFLKQVPDLEWKKDTGVRFLTDFLSILTQIHATYDHPTFATFRKEVEDEIVNIQQELALRGVQTIPEDIYSNKIDWESINFIYGCSVKPKGQLISLQKFSFKKDDEILQPGEAVVSCGYPSQVYDFFKNVEYVLLKNRFKYNSEYWTGALNNIIDWCQELATDKEAESKEQYKNLRTALNMLVTLNLSENKKFIDKGIAILKKVGIEYISAEVGSQYNPTKFSKDLYDIKEITQSDDIGKILKVVAYGFVGENKAVYQKANIQVAIAPAVLN